jgi:DNA-directed RNA polymerase specialized sigma24 family protein
LKLTEAQKPSRATSPATRRKALGPAHDQDDADVLQELFLRLLEKGLRFPEIRGAGTVWLQPMVQLIAKDWVRKKGPPPGMAG